MGLPPAPSLPTFHVVATAVPAFALVVTLFRLGYRYRRKIMWWDDAWIAASAFFMVILVIAVWLSTTSGHIPQSTKVAMYYLSTYTFTISNWTARLSILFSVIRIAPNARTRLTLRLIAVLFGVIAAVLMAQKLWVCEGGDHSWKTKEVVSCHLGLQVSVTELVTDVIADVVLIVAPLKFLWGVNLKRSQKIRLYALFSASIITTVVSIVQDWLVLSAGGLREETASMVEVAVSVIVASLPVVISAFFKLLGKDNSDLNNSSHGPNVTTRPFSLSRHTRAVEEFHSASGVRTINPNANTIQLTSLHGASLHHGDIDSKFTTRDSWDGQVSQKNTDDGQYEDDSVLSRHHIVDMPHDNKPKRTPSQHLHSGSPPSGAPLRTSGPWTTMENAIHIRTETHIASDPINPTLRSRP